METSLVNTIISRIPDYDLIIHFFVGAIWMIVTGTFFAPPLLDLHIVYMVVCSYFVGLAIDRIGDFSIEPLLQWFIKKKDKPHYKSLLVTMKKNPKLLPLKKMASFYCTITTLMPILLITRWVLNNHSTLGSHDCIFHTLILFLFVLFSLSYLKQQRLINKLIMVVGKANEKKLK